METPTSGIRSARQPYRTLFGVPATRLDEAVAADVVVLGIPYDVGTHPTRIGSRLGPEHVRSNSAPERQFLSDASSRDGHHLVIRDAGDVDVLSGEYEHAYAAIEEAVDAILDTGAVPICIGGDGAVTLPQIRSLAKKHPELVTVHFDAHTDCYPVPTSAPFTNATTFTHAATEELLNAEGSFHIGVRGTSSVPNAPATAEGLGYGVVSTDEWLADRAEILARMRAAIGDRPVFLSFDMDIFDPSVAPGVCTPEWGGLSAAEGIRTIRDLSGLNIVGADITTVSPAHDFQGNTANLASRVALEIFHLLDQTRHLRGN